MTTKCKCGRIMLYSIEHAVYYCRDCDIELNEVDDE